MLAKTPVVRDDGAPPNGVGKKRTDKPWPCRPVEDCVVFAFTQPTALTRGHITVDGKRQSKVWRAISFASSVLIRESGF